MRVWNVNDGTLRLTFAAKGVRRVRVGPESTWLATVGQDGLHIWDTRTGAARAEIKGVNDVAVAPNGRWLATVGAGTLRLIDATTFAVIGQRFLARAGSPPAPVAPGASHGLPPEVLQTLAVLGTLEEMGSVAIAPDGRWLATGGEYLRVWDAATLVNTATMRLAAGVSDVGIAAAGDAV